MRTIVDKIWDDHVVHDGGGAEPDLLYVDLHLVHEVTSPQAFDGLRAAGRTVRRPDLTLATMDHNVPTDPRQVSGEVPMADQLSVAQMDAMRANAAEHGIKLFEMGSRNQGIVHIIGPELGLTQPGMTIVCGDSHTATHGAFGALAFGIGTSEVEHVLATQTLQQRKPRSMRIRYRGELGYGVTAKDLILGTIGRIGVDGGVGHVIEYAGPPIERLSMEGRMTICNMTIEGGGRAGMIAPDETAYEWIEGRPAAPSGTALTDALDRWRALRTDEGAGFDTEVEIDAATISPMVSWGTTPGMVTEVAGSVPDPAALDSPAGYENLSIGQHELRVRTKNSAGTVDPSPASRRWTVEAPETRIDKAPPAAWAIMSKLRNLPYGPSWAKPLTWA
jgi:3-isopropylmalate/(R)-2-methylmalate dehydratase large subunit